MQIIAFLLLLFSCQSYRPTFGFADNYFKGNDSSTVDVELINNFLDLKIKLSWIFIELREPFDVLNRFLVDLEKIFLL